MATKIVACVFRNKRSVIDALEQIPGNHVHEWGWDVVPFGKESLIEVELFVPHEIAYTGTDQDICDYFGLDSRELIECQFVS